MLILLVLLQASSQAAPDIELNANVQARSVTIEKKGDARLTVTDAAGRILSSRPISQ